MRFKVKWVLNVCIDDTLYMIPESRKIHGSHWYLVLPAVWRDERGHDMSIGDSVDVYYTPKSVLVVTPKLRGTSDLEMDIIKLLTSLPITELSQEAIDRASTMKKAL